MNTNTVAQDSFDSGQQIEFRLTIDKGPGAPRIFASWAGLEVEAGTMDEAVRQLARAARSERGRRESK